jgi:hypothetical protein
MSAAFELVRRFGADLERLRVTAGFTSLRALARRAHYSHTTIAEAAGGKKFPSLDVTLAFVAACGGDVDEWRERWTRTFAARREAVAAAMPRARPEPVPAAVPWPRQDVADGSDPMQAGSHTDAVTVRAALVSMTARRQIIGRLELRHSPATHAAWGRFLGEPGLDTIALHRHRVVLTVGVTRDVDERHQGFSTEYLFDHHFSGLLTTAKGALAAWVTVCFDGAEVARGETGRWQETGN